MAEHSIDILPSSKRIRVVINGKTVADTLHAVLLKESGAMPVYYFPRDDVAMGRLERSDRRTQCPHKGEASYWSAKIGDRLVADAVWSYERPSEAASGIAGLLAFDGKKVDHWFEEDEEVFGSPRDPHHRVDVRPSTRRVQVTFAGETVADTRRALFLFETGLPPRYYIPPRDVRLDMLKATRTSTVCPYKGTASYWNVQIGEWNAQDAVWSYQNPLPECLRIGGCFCFDPEKVDIGVEGEPAR